MKFFYPSDAKFVSAPKASLAQEVLVPKEGFRPGWLSGESRHLKIPLNAPTVVSKYQVLMSLALRAKYVLNLNVQGMVPVKCSADAKVTR